MAHESREARTPRRSTALCQVGTPHPLGSHRTRPDRVFVSTRDPRTHLPCIQRPIDDARALPRPNAAHLAYLRSQKLRRRPASRKRNRARWFGPYLRREELGSASFAFIPESERSSADWYLKYRKPLSEQRLSLGKRTFICWNFVHWYEASTVETRASFVDVACRTEDRDFSATFSGERGEAATFYHVLETIRELK